MRHGGRRPGAGHPKGTKNKKTRTKERDREVVRELVSAHLPALTLAAIKRGLGLSYLVTRDVATGKFIRVTRGTLKSTQTAIEVWEKEPDMSAIRELYDRCIDRPAEPPQHVAVDGELTIRWEE